MTAPSPTRIHHQALYTSHLAAGHRYDAFAQICATSRVRNAEAGITGVLLFDGDRFAQWLHGPADAVQRLLVRIARDPRHTDMVMRYQSDVPHALPARGWAGGYCEAHDLDLLEAADTACGAAALAHFEDIQTRADLFG